MKKYRLDEVAKEFGVTRRTVERWIKSGELDSVKIGGTRRVLAGDLERKSDDLRKLPTITDITRS